MRLFLAAHRVRRAAGGVKQARLLHHAATVVDDVDLAANLVLNRLLEIAERVDVLHFRLRAQGGLALPAHRDIGVAAQAPLVHVAVIDAEPHQDLPQRLKEQRGFGRRPHVGLADDLHQRHAAAIEIEVGLPVGVAKAFVQRLAGILFHVDAGQLDEAAANRGGHLQTAAQRERRLELRDLVALRQVGIEVVLAGEDRALLHLAAKRQGRGDREVDRLAVQHR